MIESLHISNYALIDRLDVDFPTGFNVITGETGAGKSIIIGALGLLLGGRAEARVVRNPEHKSVVEAIFTGIDGDTLLQQFFADNDLDWDPTRCVIRREVKVGMGDTGRSRAFVNDTPVSVSCLREVGMRLVDIHSQHNNRLLQEETFQISLLDAIADNAKRLETYKRAYADLKKKLARYRKAGKEVKENRANEEELRQRLEELNQLRPIEGEYSQLEHEQQVLSNVTALRANASEATDALGGKVLTSLRTVIQATEKISDALKVDDKVVERLESALVELEDLNNTIREFENSLDADPRYVEYLDERIDTYNILARKLSTTPDGLALCRQQIQQKLDALENSDSDLSKLRTELRIAKDAALTAANELTTSRHEAAQIFKREILGPCRPPGMPNLATEIAVEDADLGPLGADKVTFMFSFNKSAPLMPIGGTASGGEISRLMLAIKAIVADKMHMPVMIFDEIDTGVSGSVAAGMGQMMHRIASQGDTQVLAITHLPQVAAEAETHFKVFKRDNEETTLTSIIRLDDNRRVAELALMLSGREQDEAALAAARSLLDTH